MELHSHFGSQQSSVRLQHHAAPLPIAPCHLTFDARPVCFSRSTLPAPVASTSSRCTSQHTTQLRRGRHCHGRSAAACSSSSSNGSSSHTLPSPPASPAVRFDSIADALSDIAAGKFVVVLDDEKRENEGDLIAAADRMTTAAMAFMVEHTSGVVCIAMEGQDLDRLKLPLMVRSEDNEESMYTAFTITVDLLKGTHTGISAADRAATVVALANSSSRPEEFRRPGHIFPLRYRPGGVVVRPGHTEAAVDLSRLAGCAPSGVLCEIVNREDGSMARTPELYTFAKRHGLRIITIADLIRYMSSATTNGTAAASVQQGEAVSRSTLNASSNGSLLSAVAA